MRHLVVRQRLLDVKVFFTNGKVKKIVIALVFLGGIVIGQQFGNWQDIIKLFANVVWVGLFGAEEC
jgi:hypothetical protein